MPIVKRIVCLANSRKLSGRCIAGKGLHENQHGEWVRPISDRYKEEVSERERQYADGSDPRVLDVIDVPLLSHKPSDHQQENWLLDPNEHWVKAGTFPCNDLRQFIDSTEYLWINRYSTRNGRHDKVPLQD